MDVTPAEAQALAEEAYIFLYPVVENYKTMCFAVSIMPDARFNQFRHRNELVGPGFTAVVAPNNDTLYSIAWLDLRTEPVVLSVPDVPDERYYSMQMIDGYTHNFGILGSRTTGSKAGNYLIAGPNWDGSVPPNINGAYYSLSEFAGLLGRTLIDGPDDLDNVKRIQKGYILTPLSCYLDKTEPIPRKRPEFTPVDPDQLMTPEFFNYANFAMKYIQIHPSEQDLFTRFARIGIFPGARQFPPAGMKQNIMNAIQKGIENGRKRINTELQERTGSIQRDGWKVLVDPPPFGPHFVMQRRYLTRAASARGGLYGLDPEEAFYTSTGEDTDGERLDASANQYTMTFAAHQLPEVNGFWSMTLYNEQLRLVENPIERYSIGNRTKGLHYRADGSLIIYIQSDRPSSPAASANWLPAPRASGSRSARFNLVMRLYWATEETLTKPYLPPGVKKTITRSKL